MKIRADTLAHASQAYRVERGAKFQLEDCDPDEAGASKLLEQGDEYQAASLKVLGELQERLYAQDRWAVLLIFQAMDAAGKDGTIKHVMSGINPQGCQVTSFKTPSTLEQNHDFLWRANQALPPRGQIGIFNRSYYEEVLVVRVHREMLKAERIPESLFGKHLWKQRFEDINAYERYLTRNGVIIRKFFLHISKAEQKKRFLARLDEPAKNWKFSAADLKERGFWDDYQKAYEKAIQATATPEAPWYVVPANNKLYAHLMVAGALIDTLKSLQLSFPAISRQQRQELAQAKESLQK